MFLRIVTVGKTKKSYIDQGISDFCHRIKRYARIELVTVKEPAKSSKISDNRIKRLEAKLFFPQLRADNFVVCMDRKGEMLDSEGLAQFLQDSMNKNRNSMLFLIGGELGFDEEIFNRCHKILSLSHMTFTHDMSRLILLEQLYRAFTILAGQKYHK